MPDSDTPPDADPPQPTDAEQASRVDDAMAEAMLGAVGADAPLPTVISNINPEEAHARNSGNGPMSGTGGGMWQPPSIEDAAQLFPNYEVLGLLGRGGMGAVYKARQIELDRLVAIKLLPLEISTDADFADRFRREARAMAKLNHPNIIAVHEFGKTSAGHLFFVMEFVDGANLHAIIHGPGLEPAQALAIVIQVCEALAFAHEQGVVHRDIKPANVMVDQRSRAKVADFGLARLTEPSAEQMGHTMTGTVMGTPDYMAPEQMKGMNVDHRADIYSLGVMLYEMLCKDVPRGFFDPPSVRVGADARLDEVVRRAMQQQPEKRYQQTTEMRADVDQIRTSMVQPTPSMVAAVAPGSGGQPAVSLGTDSAVTSKPPRQSKTGVLLAIAAVVLVLGVIAFVVTRPVNPAAKRADVGAVAPESPGWVDGFAFIRESDRFDKLVIADADGIRARDDKARFSLSPDAYRDAAVRMVYSGDGNVEISVRVLASGTERYSLADYNGAVTLKQTHTDQTATVFTRKELPTGAAEKDRTLELRVVGETLTASIDGKTLTAVKTTAIPEGKISASIDLGVVVKKLEYLPLDKAASPPATTPTVVAGTAALEPGAIKLWDSAEELAKTKTTAGRWENDAVVSTASMLLVAPEVKSRDGILRISMRRHSGPMDCSAGLRAINLFDRTIRRSYSLSPQFGNQTVRLRLCVGDKQTDLGQWPLPRAVEVGGWARFELRAVGDELTVTADGKTLGIVKDVTLSEAGGVVVWGSEGAAFRDIVFVPLDKPATVATDLAEPWRDWVAETRTADKLAKFGFDDDGALVRTRAPMGADWPHILTARDGAIRATWKLSPDIPGGSKEHYIAIRQNGAREPGSSKYLALVRPDGIHLRHFHIDAGGEIRERNLARWPLPAGFDRAQEHTVELRAVGDLLSVSLNGKVLGTARDSAFKEGCFAFYAAPDTAMRKMEYLSLDPPGTASIPPTGEKWVDALAEWSVKPANASSGRLVKEEGGFRVMDGKVGFSVGKFQNAAIRATVRGEEARNWNLYLRYNLVGDARRTYRATLRSGNGGGDVALDQPGGTTQLKAFDLPRNFVFADRHTMELRIQGDVLTCTIDGVEMARVQDATLQEAGSAQFHSSPGAFLEKFEYLDLGGAKAPATPGADSTSTTATKDAPFINSLGMKFVPVPGTKVLMCIHETRRQDFAAFATETRYTYTAWKKPERDGKDLGSTDQHPVCNLIWDEMQAFCAWLSKKEGRIYRLPSDREWSLAVGIGDKESPTAAPLELLNKLRGVYPWGTAWPPPPKTGNFADESFVRTFANATGIAGYDDGIPGIAPVMSFPPNALGIHDLAGNLWEWTEGWYDEAKGQRVVRGGSYQDGTTNKSYFLHSDQRVRRDATERHWFDGFRVVVEEAPASAAASATRPDGATKDAPFVNTLGMKFVPVPITGGPTDGQRVLFSVWETRVQDYGVFAKEVKREWPKVGFEQGPTHPAVNVSWEDASAFCAWLTERERKAGQLGADEVYRLPSDHEWSCTVGLGTHKDATKTPMSKDQKKDDKIAEAYPWGSEAPPPAVAGNYWSEELRAAQTALGQTVTKNPLAGRSDGFAWTAPVGHYPANRLGLHDLGGNVWEWCEDQHDLKPDRPDRVRRGGSYMTGNEDRLLSSARYQEPPTSRGSTGGFRVVLAPAATKSSSTGSTSVSPASVATATKDAPFVNSLGMKFVPVPITGGPTDGKHVLFGVWETRVQDYAVFAKETKREWLITGGQKGPDHFEQGPTEPAVMVSWEDTRAFCAWLTEHDRAAGKIGANEAYRLPSDHEWSCAIGIGGREDPAKLPRQKNGAVKGYPWGEEWPPSQEAGNLWSEELRPLIAAGMRVDADELRGHHDGHATTAPVGSYPANQFALHDLCGNVQEWCEDGEDGSNTRYVTRGGAWKICGAPTLLSSGRIFYPPATRANFVGFRVVMAPAP